MRNETFVTAAYVVTWVTLIGYAVHLRRAARRAQAFHETTRAESEDRR
jgi:CcmD family protein